MADASIDQLRIHIGADAANAASSLRSLSTNLGAAGRAAGGAQGSISGVADAVNRLANQQGAISATSNIADALGKLNGIKVSSTIGTQLGKISSQLTSLPSGEAVSKLGQLGEAISKLNGLKVSSSIANQIPKIASSLRELEGVNVDTNKFDQLASSLTALGNVPKSNISSTVNALRKLPEAVEALRTTDLDTFTDDVRKLTRALNAMPASAAGAASGLRGAQSSMGGFGQAAGEASSDGEHLTGTLQRIGNAARTIRNVSSIVGILTAAGRAIGYMVNATNEYVEDMNLFNVSLGEYANQAQEYAKQVSSVMGIEPQEWMRNQGTFATMAKGMGLASDKAAVMSQQLTQLGYDLASFYNISTEDAFQKIQAGLAGEIEPLRRLGFDLSNARLQEEAYTMGIQENVSEMTQSEKAMLRYEAMLNQVSWAQGDMARTLDSPANALRVFQANLHQAAVSIGKVFLPMLKAILPLATAAAKAVATLANMLANLTGGAQIASVDYSGAGGVSAGGGSPSIPDVGGGTGGSSPSGGSGGGSNPTAKKYKDIGDSAGKAAKKVKELKREVMSFDEINKFSSQADSATGSGSGSGKSPSGSGGKGSGGSGSGGSGGGGGGGGAAGIPIQTYDFLGNAKNPFEDIYDDIMDFVGRCMKAWDPLIKSAAGFVKEFEKQFEGLDIAGAAANAFVAFQHLVSNMARNVIETIGPMILAFNFPETLALSLDLFAQACLTLSSLINALGTVTHNFVQTGLLEFVDFLGKSVRGAIKAVIEELANWQQWFVLNIQNFADIGAAAGEGAKSVLDFAQAVASPLFDVAASVFHGLNDALRDLLGQLVASGAARSAAYLLGQALTAWALGSALSAGINGIASAFEKLADVIVAKAAAAQTSTKSLADTLTGGVPSAVSHLKSAMGDLGTAIGLVAEGPINTLKARFQDVNERASDLGAKLVFTKDKFAEYSQGIGNSNSMLDKAKTYHDKLRTSLDENNVQLKLAEAEAKDAAENYSNLGDNASFLERAHANLAKKTADANVEIQKGKTGMDAAKLSSSAFADAEDEAAISESGVGTSFVQSAASIIKGNVAKAAATGASKTLAAAEGILKVAQLGLKAAMDAFPGMAFLAIITAIATHIPEIITAFKQWADSTQWVKDVTQSVSDFFSSTFGPVIQGISDAFNNLLDHLGPVGDAIRDIGDVLGSFGNLIGGTVSAIFGLNDATGQVTDTTEEANAALEEERTKVEENVKSINEYEQSHNNVQSAIDSTGQTVDEFSQHLVENGLTFDDLRKKAEDYFKSTTNGFDAIDTSSAASLDQVNKNLANNNQVMSQWNDDLKKFVKDATDAGIQNADELAEYLRQAGPTKMGPALHEYVEAPTSAAGVEFTNQLQAIGSSADNVMADAITAAGSDQSEAAAQQNGENAGNAYGTGIDNGGQNAQQTAQDVDDATVQKFGSHYGEAKDAGRNLAGGFGDGVREASADATKPAEEACEAVVRALNGGNGYKQARDAGRNLIGGYGDGIESGQRSVESICERIRSGVVEALNGGRGYSEAKSAGANLLGGYGDGIQSVVNRINSLGQSTRKSLVQNLNGGAGYNEAKSAGANMMGGFADGLQSGVSRVNQVGRQAAESAAQGMGSNYWGAYDAGKNEVGGFTDGLWAYGYGPWNAGRGAAMSAQSGFGSNYWGAYSAGQNMGWGFNNGVASTRGTVMSTARSIANAAANEMRSALDIHSPSKVTEEIGRFFGMGIANGISGEVGDVTRVASALAQAAVGSVSDMRAMGAELGSALGDGFSRAVGSGQLSAALETGYQAARSYVPTPTAYSSATTSAHGQQTQVPDDDQVRQLADAIELGVLNARLSGDSSQTNTGDTTVVLRVGSEELARAVARGRRGLAERGVIAFE